MQVGEIPTVTWYSKSRCPLAQVDSELTMGKTKLFPHPHQIGERFSVHLLHDVGAMKFDRSLSSGEFAGNLFIEQAGGNERHHFSLTRGKLFIMFAQFSAFRPILLR